MYVKVSCEMSVHVYSVTSVLFDSLRCYGLWSTRLFCPWDYPNKNTGVSCHVLLQRFFPTQGWSPRLMHLLHCRRTLYHWATGEALKMYIPIQIWVITSKYIKLDAQLMKKYSEHFPSHMHFSLSPSSSVALKMFIRVSSINNDSGILTLRFKCCSTEPCTRRLTQSFYFYMFSDTSKCHSTTGKERLCCYHSLRSSSLLHLPARHIPDKHCVAPPAHHLSIFGLKKNRLQHVTLNFH